MEHTTDRPAHPLDSIIPDPTGMTPICDEPEFAALLDNMVADEAPRIFAVVQEYGERIDCRIAAWGMAFEDRAEVVGIEGRLRMSMQTPERALRGFRAGTYVRPRLVWVNPDAASPTDAVGPDD